MKVDRNFRLQNFEKLNVYVNVFFWGSITPFKSTRLKANSKYLSIFKITKSASKDNSQAVEKLPSKWLVIWKITTWSSQIIHRKKFK